MSDNSERTKAFWTTLVQTIERSTRASPRAFRLRIWGVCHQFGVDTPRLIERIQADVAAERKAGRGRVRRTTYNEPPQELRRRFEAIHVETAKQGNGRDRVATSAYQLQGPIEKYGRQDLTQGELEALGRFIANGLRARRQRVTASYEGGPSGDGRRDGGVHDADRLYYALHELHLSELPPTWRAIAIEIVEGGLTAEQIGARLMPALPNSDARRGAGRHFVKCLAQALEDIERRSRAAGAAREGQKTRESLIEQVRREIEERAA